MDALANVEPALVCSRVMQIFFGAFLYIYLIAKLVGPENKQAFFNRRGIFGEDINFGYPVCWQGIAVFFAIYGVVLGFGYWYIFLHAY